MKMIVCGSMAFSSDMLNIQKNLQDLGHKVTVPEFAEECTNYGLEKIQGESVQRKIQHDLIRGYFYKIKDSDAVLIYNKTKNGIENYIGGNAFLEMGFAHVLNKPIFLYNPIPNVSYKDEIRAINPRVIYGSLMSINENLSDNFSPFL